MSYNYNGCFSTGCYEGCCDSIGLCPSYYGTNCATYYTYSPLSSSARIGIGVGVAFFVIVVIVVVTVVCCRRRRALMTHTTLAMGGPNIMPAAPMPGSYGNMGTGFQGNYGAPPPYAGGVPYQNNNMNNVWGQSNNTFENMNNDNNYRIGEQVAHGYNKMGANNF